MDQCSTAFAASSRASAEVQDAFMTYTVYDDSITIKLIQEACKVLGKSRKACLGFLRLLEETNTTVDFPHLQLFC